LKQLKRIKGTQDILPEAAAVWLAVEKKIHSIMGLYNFKEIRTPIFEKTELFARRIGQLTDIVSKEMYTFTDRGRKQITLKPEMTAPVMRAYIENKLYASMPVNKLYYISPLFRQENPQAGRLRQFHQFGAEILGTREPEADVEIIELAMAVYQAADIKDLTLEINSVGDPQCRTPYKILLQEYIRPNLEQYCQDCRRRFDENPMRILDCKNETCRQLNSKAPKLADNLCPDCSRHYSSVKAQLHALNLEFSENPYLVRGLDYYTRTVFEITSGSLGAQNAVCGGGRYDLLAEELGGQPAPAVGFASGIERLLMAAEKQGINIVEPARLDIFIAAMGEQAKFEAVSWLKRFRMLGYSCDMDMLGRSIKAQMREANRQKTRFVLLIGEDELKKESFSLKLMDEGRQLDVPFEMAADILAEYR